MDRRAGARRDIGGLRPHRVGCWQPVHRRHRRQPAAGARRRRAGARTDRQLELIRIVEVELGRARTILETLQRAVDGRDRATQPAIVDVVQELCDEGGTVALETALGVIVDDLLEDDPAALGERITRRESSRRVGEKMIEALRRTRRPGDAYVVSRRTPAAARGVPTRLSVLSVEGRLVASAVTDSATVPERDFGLREDLFIQLVDLANAQAAGDPAMAGRMLLRVAIPAEFRPLLELDRDVIIEVDRVTAALPWEVLGSDATAAVQLRPLGLRSPLARQLRTRRSPPPAVTGRVVLSRALIIGDPAGGTGHLPGAEREARAVADMFFARGVPFDILLGPNGATDQDKRWNARPATLANVLHQLLHFEYQLVHYAGHGTFSTEDPARGSGWLLADGLLTGDHLTIIDRLPALVVANACHSGRVSTDLPGLAEEFMGHGVRNLVGTARTVDDESASQFSLAFYPRLLGPDAQRPARARATLGNAVLAGRRRLADDRLRDWDVYQLYGDPTFHLWSDATDDG